MLKKSALTLFASVFALSSQASIDIRIDFGATPSAGNWNNVTSSFTSVDLVDFNTGVDTGWDVQHGIFNAAVTSTIDTNWLEPTATTDGIFTTQHFTNLFSISNVPSNEVFTVEVALLSGTGLSPDQYGGTYTIGLGNDTADRTFQGSIVPTPYWNAKTDGFDNQNWLIFDNIQANGSGQILLQGAKTFPDFNSHIVNAVRITSVVPEPSTYALIMAAAMLPLVGALRKKRSQA